MSAHDQLLLGVDIGTSSSKGVLTTPDGKIVARASVTHRTSNPRPGWFEHDAEQVWWADFREIVTRLLAAQEDAAIAAIGVSGIGPCLLAADQGGRPLRPAVLYGIDTRAPRQITQLVEEFGAARIRERGGSDLTSQAVGPKLLWLRQEEPETFAATRKFLMASSYLVHRLTGRYVLDHHSASQCNPMYDLRWRRWNESWCEHIAPGLEMPELAWANEVVGTVTVGAAELTGLPEGLPVTAGTIDAWAEATSVGVRHPGDVMLMYGTTMFLIQIVDGVARHPGLWSTTGVWPDSYCLAATMPTSGAFTSWLCDVTSSDFATLTDEARTSPPGACGLVVLPHLEGVRTPVFDPDARGVIAGLTLSHTRGDLYRAALEGIAYGVRHNLESMADAAGPRPLRLVAVGGGTRGDLWTQIVSDVTGLPQRIPAETIGACYGDALLAAAATGRAHAPEDWSSSAVTVTPNEAVRDRYSARYEQYRGLFDSTRGLMHELAAEQRSVGTIDVVAPR